MNTKDKIYIVGHKRPDLDSIVSAFAYDIYMNSFGFFNYYPIRCGEVNPLTEWVFKKYNTNLPTYIPNVAGMNLVLVDHTDPMQRPQGWEKANIVGVIDHHEPNWEGISPKRKDIKAYGATTTIIVDMILASNLKISSNQAGIFLSAILDDTLGLESPTTTNIDIEIAYVLADICNIKNINLYANELFLKKDIWKELTTKEILEADMKEVDIGENTVAISQIETVNDKQIQIDKLLVELKKKDLQNPINLRIVMITDLSKKKSTLLIVGRDLPLFKNALGKSIVNNCVTLESMLSRKKQLLPIIEKMYNKNK